jgi:hypothetical protein
MEYAWTCRCCGKGFTSLPLDYAFPAPAYWSELSDEERARSFLSSDICRIGEDRFIRGCIEIPVQGNTERFVWGAWVSLSAASLARAEELWDAQEIDPGEPPRFGWLSNELQRVYGTSTLNLKASVCLRAGNLRPLITLQASEHALAREQAEGMSIARVQEIAALLLHRQ